MIHLHCIVRREWSHLGSHHVMGSPTLQEGVDSSFMKCAGCRTILLYGGLQFVLEWRRVARIHNLPIQTKNTDTEFLPKQEAGSPLLRGPWHESVPYGRATSFGGRRSTAKPVPLLKCKLLGQLHRRWGWDIRIYFLLDIRIL